MVGVARAAAAAALLAVLHPLHTSFAKLTIDSRARSIEISLRIFADDFTTVDYARSAIAVRDMKGRTIPLESCGERKAGDLIWLCFRGHFTEKPATVMSQVFFEKFEDQVNIVQAVYDGRRSNLLFAPGDAEKRLP